jgi:hypothetical protein
MYVCIMCAHASCGGQREEKRTQTDRQTDRQRKTLKEKANIWRAYRVYAHVHVMNVSSTLNLMVTVVF